MDETIHDREDLMRSYGAVRAVCDLIPCEIPRGIWRFGAWWPGRKVIECARSTGSKAVLAHISFRGECISAREVSA